MDTSSLMEQILSSDNLNRAYLQVVRNKGAEGVDGMKYTELKEHLEKNGEIIKEQLRTRKYKPQPVRRVEVKSLEAFPSDSASFHTLSFGYRIARIHGFLFFVP